MKSEKNTVTVFWKSLFACLLLSAFLIMPAQAEEERYVFERMWPELQQPWYFNNPQGVAVDKDGNVYVADTGYNRIQKFASDGTFITKWGGASQGIAIDGSDGSVYVVGSNIIQRFGSDGIFIHEFKFYKEEFINLRGIAVDSNGVYITNVYEPYIQRLYAGHLVSYITPGEGWFKFPEGIAAYFTRYIYVSDPIISFIQMFDFDGMFISSWGGRGSGDGQFNYPSGIAVGGVFVYVADKGNNRIQKFNLGGNFISKWGSQGSGDGQFNEPSGITVDSEGFVYVADTNRIQKFSSDGVFISKWGSQSSEEGWFDDPRGIAIDTTGSFYVVDKGNNRIQKFASDGTFITEWGSQGSGDGKFGNPQGIAVNNTGFVYVADTQNSRIQIFGSRGTFISKWGSQGSGDGQFDVPQGIAVDGDGNIYVVDTGNNRIQKFFSDGTFTVKWGIQGAGDGQFDEPYGIAVDGSNFVYVADTKNNRVQKFGSDGIFISKWGVHSPEGIAVDRNGFVYVTDLDNRRIRKFTSDGTFITNFGGFGSEQGLLNGPYDICVSPDGRIYVSDSGNNRIQVFRKAVAVEKMPKAIIVAGSGPGEWNNLWDATQICANYAYRALLYQGFTGDSIYYLTHANSDNRDAAATNADFQKAITDWAKDADNVFIYMVGHGGEGTFRMGESELLEATDLDTWLDTLQGFIPGRVILVYDACQSGSFLPLLKPPEGKHRILIASASASQNAYFATQGKGSFSFMFYASMFNGDSFCDCFRDAKKAVALTYLQASQLDANGNGIPNEEEDRDITCSVIFGNETKPAGYLPNIGAVGVSPAQTLNGETSALIYAENVTDADGIGRVWAVILPPGYSSASPETPVTSLPTVDLQSVGNSRYEGTYSGFDAAGVYNIAVFVVDTKMVIGEPVQTSVTQTKGEALKGDINADTVINLADAIIALKVAVNYDEEPLLIRADYVSSGIDVNGDSKIGTAEAVYALRAAAETK